MRKFLALTGFLFIATFAFSQADECASATVITPTSFTPVCSSTSAGTTAGATASSNATACNTGADDDVWYRFTANSTSVILRFTNIRNASTSATESILMAVYESSCPASSATFYCGASLFNAGYRLVQGLTPGNDYYIRLWSPGTIIRITFDLCVQSVPASPVNDDCSNATAITTQAFGSSCTAAITANTTGATASASAPSCAGSDNNDDIWYSFTASSTSIILRFSNAIETITGNTGSLGYALYNASCPSSTTAFRCDDFIGFGNGYTIIEGLAPGTVYYLRLFATGNNNFISFNFCVQDVPAPPANDNCSNAIPITTQPFGSNCAASVTANTTGATTSTPAPSCTSTENNDDIWYSFTANSASILLRFSNAVETINGSTGSLGYALYNSSCPSSTTNFSCDNFVAFGNGYTIIDGLIAGNTYYLRLFSTGANNYMSFNFCVQDVPATPVNDECANATPITTQPFGTSCSAAISANTSGATGSTPASACVSPDNNDDIWYSFTANSSSIILRFSNAIETIDGSTGSLGYALYNSSCPSSATDFSCDNFVAFGSGYRIIDGLTIGNTYYLRLYSTNANNYISFNFCVQNVPVPPVNNECANAIAITTQPFGASCASSVSANTTGATQSTPAVTCASTDANDDIWYSFTANSSSVIFRFANAVETINGSTGSVGYALYNTSCPASTTAFSCNNFVGFSGGYEIINGLTPDNTYYLRLFSTGVNNYVSFNFCIQDVPSPPSNNDCTNALPVSVVPWNANCYGNAVNTSGATRSSNTASCITSGQDNDDLWYTFVPTTTTAILRFNNAVTTTTNDPAGLGYVLYSACPSNATSMACDDFIGQTSGRVLLSGLTAGNTYYLRLFGSGNNDFISFNFCIQDPLPNDECSGALTLTVSNGFCTTPLVANLGGSTTSPGFGFPTCQNAASTNDVWFRVVIPATGRLIVQTSAISTSVNDLVMSAYTGTCGSLTLFNCDDNSNPETFPSANHSRITFSNRPAGQVIFIRINAAGASSEDKFAICAWDESPEVLPNISPGGNCITAIPSTINVTSGNIYMWVPVFDNSGNIIAEVYSDGNDLNTVSSQLFVNAGPVRQSGGQYYLDRNISVQPGQAPASPVKVRYYILNTELQALQAADPGLTSISNLGILKTNTACQSAFSGATTMITPSATASYKADHYLQASVPSFSSFYFARSGVVLPLKFISFTGRKTVQGNLLKWVVIKDPTIEKFSIEKSSDGVNFSIVATKRRDDFIQEQNDQWEYEYIDAVIQSTNYYRVKMEDANGKIVYSAIIRIKNSDDKPAITCYPNPATDMIRVELPGDNSTTGSLIVTDITGKKVANAMISPHQAFTVINTSPLSSGMYFIQVILDKDSYSSKFIKK